MPRNLRTKQGAFEAPHPPAVGIAGRKSNGRDGGRNPGATSFFILRTALPLVLLLGACVGPVPIERLPLGDPRNARDALETAHAAGPVGAAVAGFAAPEPDLDARFRVLYAASRGVPALNPRFEEGAGEPMLVVGFDLRAGDDVCRPPVAPGGPLRSISFAFCEADRPIAAVRAPAEGDLLRLYERLARTLFPDLYPERYGLRLGPFPITIGGSFGFGR